MVFRLSRSVLHKNERLYNFNKKNQFMRSLNVCRTFVRDLSHKNSYFSRNLSSFCELIQKPSETVKQYGDCKYFFVGMHYSNISETFWIFYICVVCVHFVVFCCHSQQCWKLFTFYMLDFWSFCMGFVLLYVTASLLLVFKAPGYANWLYKYFFFQLCIWIVFLCCIR